MKINRIVVGLVIFTGFVVAIVVIREQPGAVPVQTSNGTALELTLTPLTITDTPPIIPTPLSIAGVAKGNVICSSTAIIVTVSQYAIINIIATNTTGEWGLVRLGEELTCWVELSGLDLNNANKEILPIEDFSPPSTTFPTLTSTPLNVTIATPARLELRWKILSFECFNGRATGVMVGLDVAGGIPDYKYSPELPIYAQPNQYLSITVNSNTGDGEPSGTISFTLPSSSDASVFKCDKSGKNLGPIPLPTEDPPPSGDPLPTDNPVCYNPKGKVIPCH